MSTNIDRFDLKSRSDCYFKKMDYGGKRKKIRENQDFVGVWSRFSLYFGSESTPSKQRENMMSVFGLICS